MSQSSEGAGAVLALRADPTPDESGLRAALGWLAGELSSCLGDSAVAGDFWCDLEPAAKAATCRVASVEPAGAFELTWEAIIAVGLRGDRAPEVRATVFLFSADQRLGRLAEGGSDYLLASWTDAGWSEPVWYGDEFGEWDHVTAREPIGKPFRFI